MMVADGILAATEETPVFPLTDEIESGDGRNGDDLIVFLGPDGKTELEIADEMVRLGQILLNSCLHEISQKASQRR